MLTLPAYGFYCRHVVGLELRDLRLRTVQPDLRHVLVCDDVQDLVLDGVDARPAAGSAPAIRLIRSPGAIIHKGDEPAADRIP